MAGSGKQGHTGHFLPRAILSRSVGRTEPPSQSALGPTSCSPPPTHLSWGVTSLGGFLRYCLKRSSKAWPMVLMTS